MRLLFIYVFLKGVIFSICHIIQVIEFNPDAFPDMSIIGSSPQQSKATSQQNNETSKRRRETNDASSTSSGEGQTTCKKTEKAADSPKLSRVDQFLAYRNKRKETKKDDKGNEQVVQFNYACNYCVYKCMSEHDFTEHNMIMHKKNIFCCVTEECIKHFESQNGLRMHCKKFHADLLTCMTCNLVCLSLALLDQHRETSHNVKHFLCQDCNRHFTRADDAKRHCKNNCPNNPNHVIKCKHCINQGVNPDVVGAERGLLNHLIGDHGMSGDLLCIFCHRVFDEQKKIDSHHKKCTKNRPEK